MLWKASAINDYAIGASDGQIGNIVDLLIDDASWSVRWLVVETGSWLKGRKVLLSPVVLGRPYPEGQEFSVKLTQQQVKDSPDINTDRPVSQQMETAISDYYGWPPYSGAGLYMGGRGYIGGAAMTASPSDESGSLERDVAAAERDKDDPHLRSIGTVTGYHIHAIDGEIGRVEDFLMDDVDWSIHFLVVATKNWWHGKKVLISPRSVRKIIWADKLINLDVNRQVVKASPAFDESITINQAYEKEFDKPYSDFQPSARL